MTVCSSRLWLWFKVAIPLTFRTVISEQNNELKGSISKLHRMINFKGNGELLGIYVQTNQSTDAIIQGIKESEVVAAKLLLPFHSITRQTGATGFQVPGVHANRPPNFDIVRPG